MAEDWLPRLLQAHGLKDARSNGDMRLGQANTLIKQADAMAELLASELENDWWRDQQYRATVAEIRQRHALWRKDAGDYVSLCGGATDLPLAYPAAWRADAPPMVFGDLATLTEFFATASADAQGAFWTMTTLDEGHIHALDAQAAAQVRAARADWQPILEQVIAAAASQPYDAYPTLLNLLYQLGDLEAFIATYDAFRQAHPDGANSPFPWRAELEASGPAWKGFRKQFSTMLIQLIRVRELQNRADEPDLELLVRIRNEVAPPAAGPTVPPEEKQTRGGLTPAAQLPTPNSFGFAVPGNLPTLLATLRQLRDGLTQDDDLGRRRAAVIGMWCAYAERHSFALGAAAASLQPAQSAGEALGLLARTIAGEIAYFAGDYEDAQLVFADVIDEALALLARPRLPAEWLRSARSFVGFVAQWRGNALFYLGDYDAAAASYALESEYLDPSDAETTVLHRLNQGNLAFLRNNLADHRGYVTYDKKEQLLLKEDTPPEQFLGLKYLKHRAALDEAAGHYAAALEASAGLNPLLRRGYEAIIKANQANLRWMQACLLREAGWFSPDLAATLADLGAPEALYRQALDGLVAALQNAGRDKALAAALLANQSEIRFQLGEHPSAIASAEECLRTLGIAPGAEPGAALGQVAASGVAFPEAGWRVFLTLARAREAAGDTAAAAAAYEHALGLAELLRRQIRSSTWQIAVTQDKFQAYECALHFHHHAGDGPAAMFDITERLRAQQCLALLDAARVNLDAHLAPALRQERDLLAAEFATRNNAVRAAAGRGDSAALEALLAAQRDLLARWAQLQSRIEADLADEAEQLNPRPATWADFAPWLAERHPDTIVLSFTVGSEWSYLLAGDKDGLAAYELPGRATIEYAVSRLLWYVQKGPSRWREFAAASRQAAEMLLGPLAAAAGGTLDHLKGKRLLILPDAILYYLPFELLLAWPPLDAADQPIDFATYGKGAERRRNDSEACADLLPFYLLQAGPIALAQSASLWRTVQDMPIEPGETAALGVYDINYTVNAPLINPAHQRAQELLISYGDLSQTRAVAPVLKALESAGASVLALSAWDDQRQPLADDRQSNEENFKRLLQTHGIRYLLFAGHGVFNDKYPQFSGLVFNLAPPGAPPAEGTTQDGFFGLKDIFDLRMPHTELIFLAACQGGLGLISRGEGVNSLTRALMYKGSPTIIASLWSVDVLATMALVKAFFARLQAAPDGDKAALLAEARRAVAADKANPHFAHPRFWAPFVLMGRC